MGRGKRAGSTNTARLHARTHVHTLMCTHDWTRYRDADPALALSLDHPFPGMVSLIIERRRRRPAASMPGLPRPASSASWQRPRLPRARPGRRSQREGPMTIPRVERPDHRDAALLSGCAAGRAWPQFARLAADLDASGLGRVVFASP
jgi:hypothetical protein